jgi:hypothetical protein
MIMDWKHQNKRGVWSCGSFTDGLYVTIRTVYPPSGPQKPQYELRITLNKPTVRRVVFEEIVKSVPKAKSDAELACRVLEYKP